MESATRGQAPSRHRAGLSSAHHRSDGASPAATTYRLSRLPGREELQQREDLLSSARLALLLLGGVKRQVALHLRHDGDVAPLRSVHVLALLEELLAADDRAPLGHIDLEAVAMEEDGEAARLTLSHVVVDQPQLRILCERVLVLLPVVRRTGVLRSVVDVREAVDVLANLVRPNTQTTQEAAERVVVLRHLVKQIRLEAPAVLAHMVAGEPGAVGNLLESLDRHRGRLDERVHGTEKERGGRAAEGAGHADQGQSGKRRMYKVGCTKSTCNSGGKNGGKNSGGK